MISLDTRLDGNILRARPSMTKFNGVGENLEICGAGFQPLRLFLNRQVIKILEDLGVKEESFLDLQEKFVNELRATTKSASNAAEFLRRGHIGEASKLPWLIRKLQDLHLMFWDDPFLRDCLELSVLTQLRELKHRSRIPVDKGYTLYG
jgi:hypothetical protein